VNTRPSTAVKVRAANVVYFACRWREHEPTAKFKTY
jgi:hypothetical protein